MQKTDIKLADDSAPVPCWCGEKNPFYEDVKGPCDGSGECECRCGDNTCFCHNHGHGLCPGCKECDGDDDDTWEVDDGE